MKLLTELKRRNVFKVASVYLITSWLIIQIISVVSPYLKLPDSLGTTILVVLFVGFPIACIIAWAFELTADGLKRTDDVPVEESTTQLTGQKIYYSVIGLLSVAVLFLLVDKFLFKQEEVKPDNASVQQGQYQSIAVMPFQNMSSDPEQDYFSDGISEELLNSLAKLKELKVAARTSSFSFKGKDVDIKTVGTQLSVDTVLEGSVRKSNNRIRITAQLIDAKNGFHLWSETYDRELEDIFQIQDEITSNIISALSTHLEFVLPTRFKARKVDIEAYDYYLKGLQLARTLGTQNAADALAMFEQATVIDPSLAEAWAGQAMAVIWLRGTAYWGDIPRKEANERASLYIEKALSIDLTLSEAYVAKAMLQSDNYMFDEAIANINLAVQYNPNSSVALSWQGRLLSNIGKLKTAQNSIKKAVQLDPLDERFLFEALSLARQLGDAEFLNWVKLQVENYPNSTFMQVRMELSFKYFLKTPSIEELRELIDNQDNFPQRIYAPVLFYDLKQINLTKLRDTTRFPFEFAMWFLMSANLETEAMAQYRKLSMERQRADINLEELSIMQASLGNCASSLEALDTAHNGEIRIYGVIDANGSRSNSNLALNRVYCLRVLNRENESDNLFEDIKVYSDTLLSESAHGSYMLRAKIHVLEDNSFDAIEVLKHAYERQSLEWTDRFDPILQTLSDEPEFTKLFQVLEDEIAQRRQVLGLQELNERLEIIE